MKSLPAFRSPRHADRFSGAARLRALPLLTLALALLAGCASNMGGKPLPWGVRSGASATTSIVPTLVEPVVRLEDAGRGGWYSDGATNSTQLQLSFGNSITLTDLTTLRASPAILEVLEVSAMPDLSDLALMARLRATGQISDPAIIASLRALEIEGHALARALRLNPVEAGWIADNLTIRKRETNALGARAARGDKVALQQLTALSTRLSSLAVYPTVKAALRALVAAQHTARSKMALPYSSEASITFYMLRKFSFLDAIGSASFQAQVDRMPGKIVAGKPIGPESRTPRPTSCFEIVRSEWDALEVYRYEAVCVPGSQAAIESMSFEEKACSSDEAFDRMNALLIQASLLPQVQLAIREQTRTTKIRYPSPLRLKSSRPHQYNPTEQWAICEGDLEVDYEDAQAEMHPSMRWTARSIYERSVTVRFRAEGRPDGAIVMPLEKVEIFGNAVLGSPVATPSATPAPGSGAAKRAPGVGTPVRPRPPAAAKAAAAAAPADAAESRRFDTVVDRRFLAWEHQWLTDRYVPGSAHVERSECNAELCKAEGQFQLARGGQRIGAQFVSLIERNTKPEPTVNMLRYIDPSTGATGTAP